MRDNQIWAEMARRKIAFHKNEKPENIFLWGLFFRSDIKKWIERGYLKANSNYPPRCLGWYYPSKECYDLKIKPLIEEYGGRLEALEKMAGW